MAKEQQNQYIQSNLYALFYQANSIRVNMYINQARYQFEGSAKVIWERLKEPSTLNDLVDLITTIYDIPKTQALEDANDFINQLIKAKLIIPYKKPAGYIP